jgi:hypothetical protein
LETIDFREKCELLTWKHVGMLMVSLNLPRLQHRLLFHDD